MLDLHAFLTAAASFSTQQGTVREDAGMVEVCVDVSNPNNLPAGGVNVTVGVTEQGPTTVRRTCPVLTASMNTLFKF